MLNTKALFFAASCLITTIFSMDINCGGNHKAYVWNCQSLLDNWSLEDNKFYNPTQYKCLWTGITKYATTACKLLENDSCTLVISYASTTGGATGAGYTGAELKQFVQQSIDQCNSNNELSSSITGTEHLEKGGLCLCNHGSASSCG